MHLCQCTLAISTLAVTVVETGVLAIIAEFGAPPHEHDFTEMA